MTEHPDTRDLLGPYVMGTLEPHEDREVEDHLQGCASCREEAQDLRLAHERLADLAYGTTAPPEDLEARVLAGIPRRRAGRRVPSWVAAVAAAFCVLAVITAFNLLEDQAAANLNP
ncbi:MAG: zf-HC2 domain-containing protein, partial [Actinomycetota bacterium]|nr:zf-HC2 domain-containing protein [Actinomycetota bacterium]